VCDLKKLSSKDTEPGVLLAKISSRNVVDNTKSIAYLFITITEKKLQRPDLTIFMGIVLILLVYQF